MQRPRYSEIGKSCGSPGEGKRGISILRDEGHVTLERVNNAVERKRYFEAEGEGELRGKMDKVSIEREVGGFSEMSQFETDLSSIVFISVNLLRGMLFNILFSEGRIA